MGECCSKQNPQGQYYEIKSGNNSNYEAKRQSNKQKNISEYEQKVKELEYLLKQQQKKLSQVSNKDKLQLTEQIEVLDKRNKELVTELNNMKSDLKNGANVDMPTVGNDIFGSDTILGRIGGAGKVRQIVDDVYDVALKNSKINFFFKNTNMNQQRKQLTVFLIETLGGPKNYIGKDMVQAHDNLGIRNEHFDEMLNILTKTLKLHNLNYKDVKEISSIWESQRLFVVSHNYSSKYKQNSQTPVPLIKNGINNNSNNDGEDMTYYKNIGNIYEKVGSQKIKNAIKQTYEQIYKHPQLKFYFKNILMDTQIAHVNDFMIRALGGPNTYKGRDMKSVHKNLNISAEHFLEFLNTFKINLVGQNIDGNIVKAIGQLIMPLQNEIVISDKSHNLLQQLGGRESLQMAIDELYDKVEEEPSLSRFFKHTAMSHQKEEMVNYLICKLNHKSYQNKKRSLKNIHDGIFVSEDDFDLFVKLFSKTLHELKVDKAQHDNLLMVLAEVKYDICMPRMPLFDRIGGSKKIENLIASFYKKVLEDSQLKSYFKNVSMSNQKKMFKSFFAHALGGEVHYEGPSLKKSHQNLKITDTHFDIISVLMTQTLQEYDIEKNIIEEIEVLLETTRYQIVSSKTLFAQMGGKIVLQNIVSEYYEQLLNDFKLRKYFNQVNMEKLKEHQVQFLRQLLGGPVKYQGRDMIEVHKGMGITDIEFNKAMEYLKQSFSKFVKDEKLVDYCIDVIKTTGQTVVERKIQQNQEKLEQQQKQKTQQSQELDFKNKMSLSNVRKPLIVKLGGVPAIDILTEQFFDRVYEDKLLGKYFLNLDIEHLKKQLTLYLVQLFDGEKRYRGKDLKQAHNSFQITEEHFNRFLSIIQQSMESMNIVSEIQEEAKEKILTTKIDIVNTLTVGIPVIKQIGGPEILKQLIDKYHDKIEKHETLKKYFSKISKPRLAEIKKHTFLYFDSVLGGQSKYEGRSLKEIHKNLKISSEDYKQFCLILIDVMGELQFTTASRRGLGKIVESLKSQIVQG